MRIAEISNPDRENTKYPNYSEIVVKDAAAKNWLKALAMLPKFAPSTKLQTALLALLHEGQLLSVNDLIGAKISLTEMDHISHVAGENIPILTLSFARATDYRRFMGKIGYASPPQGVSIPLNFRNFLTELGLTGFDEPLRSIYVIAYSEEQLPYAMEPDQILRHESIHAIDPLLEARRENDTLIICEMIATIGEFASHTEDYLKLNSHPHFWEGYLRRIQSFTPEFFTVFRIRDGASYAEAAESIVAFVADITTGRRNTDVVRMLMDCRSFADVLEKLKSLKPNTYHQRKTADTSESNSSEGDRKKTASVAFYYRNWPGAYYFSPRSVSSLWQEASYGEEAMIAFLENNLQLGKTALDLLSQQAGVPFDTTHISRFHVQRRREGANHRIIISW